MKFSSPQNIALLTSLLIIIAFNIFYAVLCLLSYAYFNIAVIFVVSLLLFIFSYFVYKYALKEFLYDKIKVIYKTIHSHKAPKGSKFEKLDLGRDVINDVNSDVVTLMNDRREEIEQLKKLEEYRRSFIGNVSHELKTPVFNIQGYISTLLDGAIEDKQVNKDYLMKAEKNVERMVSLIEDLDIISKLESGEIKLDFSSFDIVALTKEVIELLEIKARQKNIFLYPGKNSENPVYVFADKENIRHVMVNLIDNSIKYGNTGGKTKISFYDMDENILVEIADNGIGVEEIYLPRLFERFFRVDKSRSREQGGSGLGLAIVKHIVEAHGQSVNVRSTPGVGSTFSFTLKKAENQ